ncbi:MAG TPA: S8 family serine peptidase [Candidatus Limnocylindrales bacterium]|nr:S8 family serine peptidase [Candidatus Limnocylindrales bacterium]
MFFNLGKRTAFAARLFRMSKWTSFAASAAACIAAFCAIPVQAQVVPQFVPNRYTLILQDPPVATRFATRDQLKSVAAVAYQRQIEDKQAALVRELENRQITVTGSVSMLLNAVFVTAPASRVAELAALPGVVDVKPVRRYKMALNRAVTNVNAPAAWTALGGQGNAGAGMKIGMIDTGIDQTHPTFQDPSLKMPAGFPICTTGHPEDCAYTTNKVIVARSYVRQLAQSAVVDSKNPAAQSQPDDYSPRDHVGHGTATASCAAGFSATGAAASSTGGNVAISGVAPKAYLGNYKVEGSPAINDSGTPDDILIQAVNDAVQDGMDVINFSISGLALSNVANDPLAQAVEAAAQKVIVVIAAGNSGGDTYPIYPYYGSIGSPGTAPSAITVGALVNSHVLNPALSVAAAGAPANLKNLAIAVGDSTQIEPWSGAVLQGAQSAPVVDVTTLGDDGLACGTLPQGALLNKYVLIKRGTCSFDTKAINAQTAGAIGVILYMADSTTPVAPGNISSDFIGPVVMLSNADGTNLQKYVAANPGAVVTIDMAGQEQDITAYSNDNGIVPVISVNQLASYSSLGPTPDGMLKPDLVTIGGADPEYPTSSGLYMATQTLDPTPDFNGSTIYSSTGYMAADGTSFAAPLTAGAAALIKQAHPSYTAAQIKSLLVNSTGQDVTTDDTGGFATDPESIGAGRLDVGAASAATVTAVPATVSFGLFDGSTLPSKTITLTNAGKSSVTLSAAVAASPASTASGPTVSLSSNSITLPAGGSASLTVSLTGTKPTTDGGKFSGMINLTGSGATVHIPYLFLAGSKVVYNVNPISSFAGNTPGQDGGPFIIQVTDANGVPISGAQVKFTAATRGAVTLQSYGFGEPACAPAASSTTVTCPTDQFGFAYVEVQMGQQVGTDVTVNGSVVGASSALSFTADAFTFDPTAVPTITQSSVVNGATFDASAITPGSYMTITGTNLLDTNNLSGYSFYNNLNYDVASTPALPMALDYTSVSFDVPSKSLSVPGYVSFVSPTQVNVFVPYELKDQTSAQVKVTTDEFTYGNVVTVPLTNYAPGFFSYSASGLLIADAVNTAVVGPSNPAVRGQPIQLYCNGLGPVNNQPASGQPAPGDAAHLATTTTTPVVTIGGQPATVQFAGLAPGFVGLYQVNVTVPAGISAGNQPITISIGGATSPSTVGGQTVVLPVK